MNLMAVCSGGMDSTTLAYEYANALEADSTLTLISFDYGQRHKKELDYAAITAGDLNAEHVIVDLHNLKDVLTGSALTDNIDVPEGHYEDETMRLTVVPNRNMIMLSVAVGVAVARGISVVGTAIHAGDHAVYPDCRPSFIDAMNHTARVATKGFAPSNFIIAAPFVYISKSMIATRGDAVGVPWQKTWSCYKGEARHCGKCGTCTERREAFEIAGVTDPTVYDA